MASVNVAVDEILVGVPESLLAGVKPVLRSRVYMDVGKSEATITITSRLCFLI